MKRKITTVLLMFILGTKCMLAQIPTDSLVVYWPLNGNANDSSGNSNHGTMNNISVVDDKFGNANSAFQFSGTGSYVQVSNLAINSFPLSFSCFINIDTTKYMYVYSSDYWNSAAAQYYGFNIACNNATIQATFGKGVGGGGTSVKHFTPNIAMPLHTWNHVVVVFNNHSDVRIYLNGEELSTTVSGNVNMTQISFNNYDDRIGKAYYTSNNFDFSGKLDQIRIYNKALSLQEIANLYLEFTLVTDTIINDTSTYFVSSNSFENAAMRTFLHTIDTITYISGAKIFNKHYEKFIYNPTYCTFIDTQYVAVADTLIINVNLTGIMPPNNINMVKVFPNPAHDFIVINLGNYQNMNNYWVRIENLSGQVVYENMTNTQELIIPVNSFGNYGTYNLKIINAQSQVLTIKKIVLY